MIKLKDKAGYQIEPFTMNHHIVYNYCSKLLQNDFIKSCLLDINLEEFVNVLKELLKQKNLLDELKRKNPIFSEEPDLNLKRFIKTFFKWKRNLTEISELEKNRNYLNELESFKEHLSNNMYELNKFSEKLLDHQQSLVRYHMSIHYFNLLRVNVSFFLQILINSNYGVDSKILLEKFQLHRKNRHEHHLNYLNSLNTLLILNISKIDSIVQKLSNINPQILYYCYS